ncbi:MAG: hypothetical protein AAF620_13960, partial [Bacteroidota bacterium]
GVLTSEELIARIHQAQKDFDDFTGLSTIVTLPGGGIVMKGGLKLAARVLQIRRVARGGTIGVKTVGAARSGFDKVLQTGGHTLKNSTLKALNLTKTQGNKAIHNLKDDLLLPGNFHGKIMGNGDFVHPRTDEVLGNLFDYLY